MIYLKSNGEEIDTSTMADTYIQRALAKAEEEGNQANIDSLNAELAARTPDQTDPNAEDPTQVDDSNN